MKQHANETLYFASERELTRHLEREIAYWNKLAKKMEQGGLV